ncbi:MAG: hypothetical protein KDC35_09730 [Acidobacteria bacterium]|nr:hypothetical protein [Acidobacteriota bacterium]
MTRSLVWAILTFALLFFANLAVFAFLYFESLSSAMVTQRLVASVNDARSALHQSMDRQWDGRLDHSEISQNVIPRLAQTKAFKALVVLDGQGNVIYRERINQSRFTEKDLEPKFLPIDFRQDLNLGPQRQVAVEYDPDVLDREVRQLQQDLYQKLGWAVGVSGVLLLLGCIYVVAAYKKAQRMLNQAQRADQLAYVGTLASGLAHEIRNPLNSMNMNIQLMQEELEEDGIADRPELTEMFDATRREIQRLEKLVSAFLSYARPTQLLLQPASINELTQSILRFLDPELKQRRIDLVTDFADSLPTVNLDDSQMRQALLNVIQNAIHVLQAEQTLNITTRAAAGDRVLVEIEDSGPGIAPLELANIFKVFYSTKRGGTGLGLPIAQRIVESHGGGIKVESEVGRGTKVTFILPKAEVA